MNDRIDFDLYDESGFFWLAPADLGGYELLDFVGAMLEGGDAARPLRERGLTVPVGLYGDGGRMKIRVLRGELSADERDGWTARLAWWLDLSCGQMLVGSSADTDAYADQEPPRDVRDEARAPDFCSIEVAPGRYRVAVHSYPPRDLSTAWMTIVDPDSWAGKHPEAEPLEAYFDRTRPGEELPYWAAYALGRIDYAARLERERERPCLDFVVQLTPSNELLPEPRLARDAMSIAWESRKPDRFPLGVPFTIPTTPRRP